MNTTINQRIREIADKLCGGNMSELSRITGVSQPALRDIVGTKQAKPRFEIISQLVECSAIQINADWLITGKGPMQKRGINTLQSSASKYVSRGAIPVFNIRAAPYLHTLFTNNKEYIIGELSIPNAPRCDGAIYVLENSMYPLIKSGDMAVYKQLHNIDNLQEGEMYIVDYHLEGDDMLVVNYVKWEEKSATLRLIGFNERFEDMIIPASAVRAIALVKIVVTISSMT